MALIPKPVPSTQFEQPSVTMDDTANPPAQSMTQPVPQSHVPAVQASTNVAVSRPSLNPFADMEKVYEVEYNTLTQLMATNGNFLEKENGTVLGDAITLQLMSYQNNFVLSPGVDGEDAKKLVRYSNDGITTKDGEDCVGYLNDLKQAGYNKAYMSKRVVLVGALLDAGKAPQMADSLVQIDLAPTSKTLFDRHVIQSAFNISKGKTTKDKASTLRLTAKVAKNASNQIYTLVNFAQA